MLHKKPLGLSVSHPRTLSNDRVKCVPGTARWGALHGSIRFMSNFMPCWAGALEGTVPERSGHTKLGIICAICGHTHGGKSPAHHMRRLRRPYLLNCTGSRWSSTCSISHQWTPAECGAERRVRLMAAKGHCLAANHDGSAWPSLPVIVSHLRMLTIMSVWYTLSTAAERRWRSVKDDGGR